MKGLFRAPGAATARTTSVLKWAVLSLVGLLGLAGTGHAAPIRTLTNLVSITFWEATGAATAWTFPPSGGNLPPPTNPGLLNRRTSPLGGGSNFDFSGLADEIYDVFYSDANGDLNIDGECLTVEAEFNSPTGGGGLNIAEVQLNFVDGSTSFMCELASAVYLGVNAIPGSAQLAVDGNLSTATVMGNTSGQPLGTRLRITLCSPCPVGEPPTSTPTRTTTPSPTPTRTGIVKSEICGIKFHDLNGNGTHEPQLGEPGLAGWTINLVFGTPPNVGDLQATTDANGHYCFTGLAPGTYNVFETLVPGWTRTFPTAPGTYAVTVPPSVTSINFGNKVAPTPTPTLPGPCALALHVPGSAPMCTGVCYDDFQTCCLVGVGDEAVCTCLSDCSTPTPTPTCGEPISVVISTGSQVWSLIAPPAPLPPGPATVITPNPSWTTLPNTQWISAIAACTNTLTNDCPGGIYSYQLCWVQCGPLAASPLLQVLADNTANVYLDNNPTPLATTPSNNIGFTDPEIIQGFSPGPGLHTLQVDVYNNPFSAGGGTATGMDLSGVLNGSVRIVPCPGGEPCVGDCDGSGDVTVDKLITMVNIALGSTPLAACMAGAADSSGDITVDEFIVGVGNALTRCNGHCHASDCPTCMSPNRCRWLGGGCLCVHLS